MNSNAPVIVFGEGSASVFLISQLIQRNELIVWINGSGARLSAVMPYVKSEKALGTLVHSLSLLPDTTAPGSMEKGTFHRVFRNKSFKLPSWKRSASLESQKQAMEEAVWAPEQVFLGVEEFRAKGVSPFLMEEALREQLENHPQVTRVQNVPIVELEVFEQGGKIQFANKMMTEFKQFYFCDTLSELNTLPKLGPVFKHQIENVKMGSRLSALQVIFHHSAPFTSSLDTGLVIPMNRDSGETFDRDAIGYFVSPTRSVWTVFLQPAECEENHEIMKKLRKIKQSLNRAFESPELLPEGKKDFTATIEKEQVRFENNFLFTEGAFKRSQSNPDFVMVTDSFGPTVLLEKLADHFGIQVDLTEMATQEEVSLDLESIEIPEHLLQNESNPDQASV